MSTRVVFPRSRGTKGTHPLFVSFKGRGRREGNKPSDGTVTFRPSRGESKADLVALHRDNMRERKVQRYIRQINVRGPWYWKARKQDDAGYRKSIWPKDKTVGAGRMLNGQR